jgi:hypothetical protein
MSHTHLVDLAGSERARRTQATGDRLKEGASINQSLSTLAHVISELAKGSKKGSPPFRNSKLTLILKESLSGNSKTVMMAAIAPSSADYAETLSTLKFASSVKLIQTKAKVNAVSEGGVEEVLRQEVQDLQEKLKKFEADKAIDTSKIAELQETLQERQQLQFAQTRMGSMFETALKKQRERVRAGALVHNLDSESLSTLQELYSGVEKNRAKLLQKREQEKRRSSISVVWSGNESSSESDHDDEMIKIRLQNFSLDALTRRMKQLRKEADNIDQVVNLLREPHMPQIQTLQHSA